MKTKYLLLGAIFAVFGLTARAQVYEMYYQGFESSEAVTYSRSPVSNVRMSSTIHSSGNRAIKLVQNTSGEVELILDTIDFTQNTTLRYIALRFDQICRVPKNSSEDIGMAKIYYKRANQTSWTSMSSQQYNITGDHSNDFSMTNSFLDQSYADWVSANQPSVTNGQWHSERFDLDNVMTSSVPVNERKLLIKFVLRRRNLTGTLDTVNTAWWLDNIKVSASADRMVSPKITMLEYPNVEFYPNSRGARIKLMATTTVSAGINPDSVYLYYRGGSDTTRHKLMMTPSGANQFECRIPFYGYDTLMRFFCVACDNTGNANKATFPPTDGTWVEYRAVRGPTEQPGLLTPGFTPTATQQYFPFPTDADHRSEFVYDSALLREAGYGPGAITAFRFKVGGSGVLADRQHSRFQIKMKNVPANYSRQIETVGYSYPFTPYDDMQTVYDSALTIPAMPANLEQTITFQDTFFYAGSDVLLQITYSGNADYTYPVSVHTISTASVPSCDKKSIFSYQVLASYGYDPFTSSDFLTTYNSDTKRPAFIFTETHLQPLLYDVGVSELVDPSFDVPMTENPDSITVKLSNFGERAVNAVRISYEIDDNVNGYYDWSGSLAGGHDTNVLIATNVSLTPGFHTLRVWVEDTVTSAGQRYRDHEPYNDTSFSEFVVCAGPMSGVRNIGGPSADFNDIEEFLFSLSRCGIDDSLIVRLAAGNYPAFVMPAVPGLSAEHYIVFEQQGTAHPVLYADETTNLPAIVNLEQVSNIRFRNISFVRQSGALTDMVTLSESSSNCSFEGCTFTDMLGNPVASLRINSMINSGYSNGLLVDSCTFVGGNIGVNAKGPAPDNYSMNVVVRKSSFSNQYSNAIKVEYVGQVTLEDNEMMDVVSNTSYVVLLNGCSNGVSVQRNRIYTTHGAGGMAITDVNGQADNHALVVNNMIVSDDDGSANQLTTALNVIQGSWIDVAYNSVKMKAPDRVNVAAATFGGGNLANSCFVNNIVAAVDNANFALSFQPLASTTLSVGHNNYYSGGVVLNRRGTTSYTSLAAWQAAVVEDSLSVSVNPNFLCTTPVDLRTYNRNIKGVGIPLPAVTDDIYGNSRGSVTTCPGAFEFSSLPYDFEPEALVSPSFDTCYMPSQVELVVRMRNNGIQVLGSAAANPLQIKCRVNNGPTQTVTINDSIPADDTISVHTGIMLSLPSGTFTDATYTLRVWCTQADDPNQINDTNVFTVVSRYHPAAPADIIDSVDYFTIDTITPTVGVNTWQVYGSASAPRRPSQISWYLDSTDTEPFFVGPTYITGTMLDDLDLYIRQRRAMPIVRITQVEILRTATAVGLTSPMPLWMENNRKVALQLTNIGDATAYLEGDTLMTVSPTASMNDKKYAFGNVKIEPGRSLVVQFMNASLETDSSVTIINNAMGGTTVAYNTNIAFVYKRNGVVEDALPLNDVITASSSQAVQWSTLGVPNYVWSGNGLTFQNNTAGVIRTGFSGGVGDWELSSSTMPMFIAATDPDWVMYTDNGCEPEMAHVRVAVREAPSVDIRVAAPAVPESDCGLGLEEVTVMVSNYGIDTANGVVLHYSTGMDTVTDTLTGVILPHSDTLFTFGTQLNLAFPVDTVLTLCVWADSVDVDPVRNNDTSRVSIVSRFTPSAPAAIADRTVPYATCDTITDSSASGLIPVWYDYNMNPVDTAFTHVTDLLYANGTMGMAYMTYHAANAQVGNGTLTNGNTGYPSPYQPNNKFVKQQYIYTAHDLAAAGLEAGTLRSIAFYLDTMLGNTTSVDFLNYTIALGMTPDTIYSGNSAWKDAPDVVFQREVFTLYKSDSRNWVTHHMSAPFVWDGESSLVVQVSYELAAAVTTGVTTRYTAKANTTIYKNSNGALSPSTEGFVGSGNRSGNRPNALFTMADYGCVGPMTTYNVTLSGMPQHDAAIAWDCDLDTMVYNSCDTISLPLSMRNQGSDPFDTLVMYYYLDNQPLDSTVVADTFAPGNMYYMNLFNRVLAPGRHSVTAIAGVSGDSISSNDTIRGIFTVRFCAGDYTIAANDASADYPSFGAAIDTLNQVGIVGPVNFLVQGGTYNEQVVLNNVPGSSETNTVSFIGQSDDVLLTASTSQALNYVMLVDGASNIHLQKLHIVARPLANNVNYANALVMQNDSNIYIDSCHFKVKGTISNNAASCIVLQGNVSNLYLNGNVTDSGFYAFRTLNAEGNYNNFHFTNNSFLNFASGGIYIRDIRRLNITQNEIRSGNSSDNRGLTGIYLAATTDSLVIVKNAVYLVDERKGAKRGLQFENVVGSLTNPVFVANNMIGTYGTDSKNLPNINNKSASAGVVIDSGSAYINLMYNSIRVRGSNVNPATSSNSQMNTANDLSYALWCGSTPTQISVMNNILSNFGYGYAYFISQPTNIANSNYNAYYTEAAKKFAWNGTTTIASLANFQGVSATDGVSFFEEPFFAANDNLHLTMTNFAAKAQYNPDVIDDIDGNMRPPIGPTIGAHELNREIHDMAVVRISKPFLPENINNPTNIETDSVLVVASFNNNGLSNETGVYWYAYIEGYESTTRSVNRNLGSFVPAQMKTDSVMIPTQLGIIDTNHIHVVVVANIDQAPENNEMSRAFYLAPAFNLSAENTEVSNQESDRCNRYETQIGIKVKNSGSKDFPANTTFKIGYHTALASPNNITVATLPDTVEEYVTLNNILPVGSEQIFYFSDLANLYPTDNFVDIQVRVQGWVKYQYDITTANDTTPFNNTNKTKKVDSYYSPAPPEGHDTTLAYGTWGEVRADQENSRPIRWYRDSTAAPFYSPTQYNASRRWSNTPQYFHDSVYYLNALSAKGCPSFFSEVHVNVAAQKSRDMAVETMLAPLGSRVYMENDTVRVRVANYGTSAQNSTPITYVLKTGNTVLQTVTETITENIAPNQTYIYTFDSLLALTIPTTSNKNYTLNVYTDLTNDATRRNDTLRAPLSFVSFPENRYNTFDEFPSSDDTKFDITRVSFNGIDLQIPQLNRQYTDLASYNSPDYPVLHVTRGTTDSILIQVSPLDPMAQTFRCRGTVAIDYNRDGLFNTSGTCNEVHLNAVPFYGDSLLSTVITIPDCASLGYMRMRVKVMGYAPESTEGHIIDFLLFVDEEAPDNDLAITQIVSPRDNKIFDTVSKVVYFRMSNRGANPVTSVNINYSFIGEHPDSALVSVMPWTGNLLPGQSTVVALPAYSFPLGTTTLTISHDLMDDADSTNDVLEYEYHHFHTIRLVLRENFDEQNIWYAPRGYNEYSRNYWMRGMPHKTRIDTTYSGDYAWVTDLNSNVVTGKRGNVSYLYSPVIDIASIRPDTISVRIRHNLPGGSTLRLEYYNFNGRWVNLEKDTVLTWYNDVDELVAFTGTLSNSEGYKEYHINTVLTRISSEFQERLQFRFAYSTPMGTSPTSAYGDGCAIDDFYVGRAQRKVDAGVVAITKPVNPSFGQTIYPEVVVKNYGTDTLKNTQIGYTHYGSYLAKINDISCNIAPGATDTFTFTSPFIITNDYPDTFYINAFAYRSDDLYHDNDSTSCAFGLSPLGNDISAENFLSPLAHVVAGDTAINVTMRIRNFGSNPISRATATYIVNNVTRVDEQLDFEELLGRPLQSLEYYNYTFHRKISAPMGVMDITAFIKSPNNDYIYNDTIAMRTEGIMSITDVAAKAIIVDDSSDFNFDRVVLAIENIGSRGVNNFEVGFWIDNDTTTMVRETYYRTLPLAALNTGYHTFSHELPKRSSGYHLISAFVHVDEDNDFSNDTTNVFGEKCIDVEVVKVLVEENANNDCRVLLGVRNNGNAAVKNQQIRARVAINGSDSIITNVERIIMPGEMFHLELNRRIPKSPTRQYVGTGWIRAIYGDLTRDNDMTSIVEVINYFEDVPTVNGANLVLEQNYPNPFSHQTTIPFTLPNAATVRFFIMDAMGHIVHRDQAFYQAGSHLITVDMQAYAAGIYYYGIEVDGQRQMRKMILK